MFKNVAGQKVTVSAVDTTTGAYKAGDAANITVYLSKDDGAVTALTDTSATEADATNAKGDYLFDLTQAETNADKLRFTGKSSTSGIVIVPQTIYTLPSTGILAPATSGRTLVVDAAGLADANAVKIGPSGSGTAQTAKDLGAINVTQLNTLSSHDPGATLGTGTSTLTQTQVSGGSYALNSSSFAWNAALDFSTTQKASLNASTPASIQGSVGSVAGNVGGNVVGSVGSVTGNVGGNVSGTVTLATSQPNYAPSKAGDAMTLTAAYDAAKTALQSGGAVTITDTTTLNRAADIFWRRNMANVEASANGDTLDLASGYGHVQQAQMAGPASGSVLPVYKTDGTTLLGSITLGTTANTDPVTSMRKA